MNLKKYVLNGLVFGLMAMPFAAGSGIGAGQAAAAEKLAAAPAVQTDLTGNTSTTAVKEDATQKNVQEQKAYSLKLDTKEYTTQSQAVNGQQVAYRVYADRVYAARPVDAAYEKMTIYIPEAYFQNKAVNGYTARTAPIFLPNEVGGYMPGGIAEPGVDTRHGNGANAVLTALSKGYVVAAPAIRGRTLQAADGTYTGKAPALIVDYKAAVRYLRYNKKRLPAGDTEKIVSNGTSAGGALSALLGAAGNSRDYDVYLKEIGAAQERDDIFASSDYCPITNLDHADMAYEWVFNGVNDYHQRKMGGMPPQNGQQAMMPSSITVGGKVLPLGPGPVIPPDAAQGAKTDRPANAPSDTVEASEMSAAQREASDALKKLFPGYVNSLGLKDDEGRSLTLDESGNGSFKDYLESFYLASAQRALDQGEDLSRLDWLTIENGKAVGMDLGKYAVYATRLKAAPAFDALDGTSAENNEFGTKTINNQHFTSFSLENSTASAAMADAEIVKLMNPLNYIGNGQAATAKYWRIRHGEIDRDTSLAVPLILATKLKNSGACVDFASPWNRGHDGDYDLTELFAWMDSICKAK